MHEFSGTFAWLHPDRETLIKMLEWLEDNEVEEPCITQYGRHLHTTIYNHGYEIFVPRKKLEKPIVINPDQMRYANRQGKFMVEFTTPTIRNYAKKFVCQIPGIDMEDWESKWIPHMLLSIRPRRTPMKKPIDFPITFVGQNSSPRIKTKADYIEETISRNVPQSRKNHIVKLMES
ncbi:hypothetical protein EVB97_042 [Rhizobium phage RHph_Y65]|uniref:Uncharacterized protein n=1 Tax=Rhizobium phage RHph_Y65 TaxID=2509785 RepID=A0A7S5UVT3_9CAUD|nr:hypothetical protein PQC17_gp042 [Rhizobium phage RHph_Y65]QIG72600.1 hypothetical protein EVB97_042 [Rhizobium phage RHph_Y65]